MSLVAKIYDLATSELADISGISLERSMSRRLNLARSFTIQAPAGHELLTTIAGDGYTNLRRGNRKLLVWEDDTIIFHGRIFSTERNGDGNENLVTIVAFDPWMELGYESQDLAGRIVRDDTGNFIDPVFNGGGTISGPDLIQQILTNSQGTDTESGPNPGEGPLPIALTGDFDIDVPPAVDLSPVAVMTWPVMVGDFIAALVNTGVVDVDMRPVDPAEDLDPYIMVELSAVSSFGTDRHATVHFDYWTGDHNASTARHVSDFATICNKLYDYLGPRLNTEHWRGNITPGSPGTTADPTASRALYGGPGEHKGTFFALRTLDSVGIENAERQLFIADWNAEQSLRMEPREMLFITPAIGDKALFDAPADFDVGDLIAVNTGADFGLALAETQRVYGYDITWDRQGKKQLSALITSADAE